jgi:hypothetical protein
MNKLTCFKAYDIRGKLGEELNEEIAWRIGRAYGFSRGCRIRWDLPVKKQRIARVVKR